MTLDANADAFIALQNWGLITDAQHEAVRAHPDTPALPPIPGPAHALAWMLVRGVIGSDALNAALDKLQAAVPEGADSPESLDDAEEAVYEAEDLVELAGQGITHEALQTLSGIGLIDAETLAGAQGETPLLGTVAPAPAVTLAWLVTDGGLAREKFDAMRVQVAAEPAFAMAPERRRIVEEAAGLIAADEKLMNGWKQRAQRQRRLGAFKLLVPLVVVAGGLGWFFLTPDSVPACDAASTRKTLDSLMLRMAVEARMSTLGAGENRLAVDAPSLSGLREVGYRKAERVRGCAAVLTQGDSKEPMAFTIGASAKDHDRMVVRGADLAIVEARFGQLDASGKPRYNAEPIGREALGKAFRDATDNLGLHRASPGELARNGTSRAGEDTDRTREVAEIEPTGACRTSADGQGQTCPLLIEYNDRLLGALGGGDKAITLRGDFTFVQDGGAWRVGDGFAKTFARSLVEARMKSLGVTDAAHKPG